MRDSIDGSSMSDDELIYRACSAEHGEDFAELWRGGIRAFRSSNDADVALCVYLAVWTGGDAERVDRLYRRSGLFGPQWDEPTVDGGPTYGETIVQQAIADLGQEPDSAPPKNQPEFHVNRRQSGIQVVDVASSEEGEPEDGAGHEPQADMLIRIGQQATLFATPEGELFARYPENGHWETRPMGGPRSAFASWLLRQFHASYGRAPSSASLNAALAVLGAKAKVGPLTEVYIRVAELAGALYIDLADSDWRAIEVTHAGWQIVSNPPVRFRRMKGMLPLVQPEPGGALTELRPFLNTDEEGWQLVLAFIANAFMPQGSHAVLNFYGESGSAKTTATRILRMLIDPHQAMARAAPKDERDLAVAAKNSWLLAFDNLSHLPDWLSDGLCRLSSGSAFATRALHTDDEEALFTARRPVILNGIELLPSRTDLLDRLIPVELHYISPEQRLPDREFASRFEAARPRILGAILDALSLGLRRRSEVQVDRLPRLADFVIWAEACAPALGIEEGAINHLFAKRQADAMAAELESSLLATKLREFCADRLKGNQPLRIKATELLEYLNQSLGIAKRPAGWPANARALGSALRRLAPALRKAAHISLHFDVRDGQERRLIVISQTTAADGG